MKKSVGVLLLPAILAISGCVVVPAGGEYGVAAPPPAVVEAPPPMVVEPPPGPAVVEEAVEVPVVYGEPVYYPPPITVAYTYDYYTYENVGGYVNIVFWRNGHRYRHEPWYDHGRRMRAEHMHEWERSHRVPYRDFERHREFLERKHHISHPDNYYGIRPGKPGRENDRRRDWDRPQPKRDINDRAHPQQRPQWRPGPETPPYSPQQGHGQQQRPQWQRGNDQTPPYNQQQKPQGYGQQQRPQWQQGTNQRPTYNQQQKPQGYGQQQQQFQQRPQRIQTQQGQGQQFQQRQQRMQTQQGSGQQQQHQIQRQRQQNQDGSGQQPRSQSKPSHDRDQQKNQMRYQ